VNSTPRSSPTPSEASDSDTEALPEHSTERSTERRSSSAFFRQARRRLRRGWVALNDFMTMPLWATLASLLVACVRPLQNILDNHMEPVKGALAAAGNCSIPLTLVVLGAYFYVPPEETSGRGPIALPTSTSADSLADSFRDMVFFKRKRLAGHSQPVTPGETRTVIIAILSRMIITPLLLLPLMAASAKFDWQRVLEE
jgi:auxin efflux carrier family protein